MSSKTLLQFGQTHAKIFPFKNSPGRNSSQPFVSRKKGFNLIFLQFGHGKLKDKHIKAKKITIPRIDRIISF